jgi:hypothetical protein
MNDIVVVFNSLSGSTGTNHNDLHYNFDWSKLKETKYEVSMSCVMKALPWSGDKIAMAYIHLGNTPLVYRTGDQTISQNTEFLGYLFPSTLQNTTPALATFLSAKENDNPHFHLNGRPTETKPRITFRDGTGALLTDSAGGEIPDYVLTIRLIEVIYPKDYSKDYKDRYS